MFENQWFFILLVPIGKPDKRILEELSKSYSCIYYRDNVIEIWFKEALTNIPQVIYKITLMLSGIEDAYIAAINTPYKPLVMKGIYNRGLIIESVEKPIIFDGNTDITLACTGGMGQCLRRILEFRTKLQLIKAWKNKDYVLMKVKVLKKVSVNELLESCLRIVEPIRIPP